MIGALARLPRGSPHDLDDIRPFLDGVPVAIMLCDPRTFLITYANPKSVELLELIKHVIPIRPDQIVGTSIDVFHKEPSHQRRLLSDPKRLPHSAIIKTGDQILDLNISAVRERRGHYAYAMLSWSVITDKIAKDRETKRLLQMIDNMPINVMTCDMADDFRINYVNRTSIDTLSRIEQHLPIKAKDLLGQTIDIFHKKPTHQRQMLADASRLPHTANIRVGPEVLNLKVSAIRDDDGSYLGPMLTWSIITDNVAMAENVSSVVDAMASTSTGMQDSARNMLEVTERAQNMASAVAAASVEMAASFQEVTGQISTASSLSQGAAQEAGQADDLVRRLADNVEKISAITGLIETIASQTNLLALNATIEAARAGEAGRGFAVVAQEVKQLATQTAKATQDIRNQIATVQEVSADATRAVSGIAEKIDNVSKTFLQISAAVEEQSATTDEVTRNIAGVSDAARETGVAAMSVQEVADNLSGFSQQLNGEIASFLDKTKS